jgi:spectrin alpha
MADIGDVIDGREIQVLETAEDIQARREQVLARFAHFKEAAKYRRDKLEDSREYQYFKRDADELEMWINEKIQLCSQDDTYRDTTSVQVNNKIIFAILLILFRFRRKFKNMKLLKKK